MTPVAPSPRRAEPDPNPGVLAERAIREILAELGGTTGRGVVVDSPPGAGKTALVVRVCAGLAGAGEPVTVVAQTNEQVDDLTDRLAGGRPDLSIGRLSAHDYVVPARIARHHRVIVSSRLADLADCAVVLGTAAKWAVADDASSRGSSRPWAVIDEAYQMRSDLLLRIADRFERALFVGDPGQLDPFSTVDTQRWTGLTWDPMQSAVAVLLRHNPDLPVHRLPVSWRLSALAAPVVAEAFYPFSGFQAGTGPGERRLEFGASALGDSPVDAAVEEAAASGWALYEMPARHTLRTDAEAVKACAALASRVIQRGAMGFSERAPRGALITPSRIAIGTAHRDQARAIRSELAALGPGLGDVAVDTANRLQGREFDVTIVLHPLSGRRDASEFHLEAGRLCVLVSRHRHACIVVARAGIPDLLDAHPSTEPVHLNVPVKFPDGWEANHAVMANLASHQVRAL